MRVWIPERWCHLARCDFTIFKRRRSHESNFVFSPALRGCTPLCALRRSSLLQRAILSALSGIQFAPDWRCSHTSSMWTVLGFTSAHDAGGTARNLLFWPSPLSQSPLCGVHSPGQPRVQRTQGGRGGDAQSTSKLPSPNGVVASTPKCRTHLRNPLRA